MCVHILEIHWNETSRRLNISCEVDGDTNYVQPTTAHLTLGSRTFDNLVVTWVSAFMVELHVETDTLLLDSSCYCHPSGQLTGQQVISIAGEIYIA